MTAITHPDTKEMKTGKWPLLAWENLILSSLSQPMILPEITIGNSYKLVIDLWNEAFNIFFFRKEDFTLMLSLMLRKAARDVQMALMFHLIEHRERQF